MSDVLMLEISVCLPKFYHNRIKKQVRQSMETCANEVFFAI